MLSSPDNPATRTVDRPVVVLDDAGTWRYAESGVAAVGARHVTLGEVARPRVVGRRDEHPEGVLLWLSEIVADSRLNWVLQSGTRLDGADDPQFLVTWETWQEHASEPVDAWLPEHDASGIDRCLAATERRWRLAKKALDDAGIDRMWTILLATRVGRSRREVSEILGLSPGRVQQLNEDPPAALVEQLDRFARDAAYVVESIGSEPHDHGALRPPRGLGADRFDEVVTELIALGLLEVTSDVVRVTDDGHSLAAAELGRPALSRKARKPGLLRERVGDAGR